MDQDEDKMHLREAAVSECCRTLRRSGLMIIIIMASTMITIVMMTKMIIDDFGDHLISMTTFLLRSVFQ